MSKNFERLKACVSNTVKGWNRTTLTDIEKYSVEMYIVWGIVDAALYVLPCDEYQALKDFVLAEYGLNVGGAQQVNARKEHYDSRRTNQRKQ